jgi:hypothetical protein
MHIGAVDGGVAAGSPAAALRQERPVWHHADINFPIHVLGLCMATQTEIRVGLVQQFAIRRAMRVVANIASLTQSFVLKHEWTGLFPVALGAGFIATRHGQSARRFEDVRPMRIVALNTIHVSLRHRVMLGHSKLSLDGDMAIKTGSGIFSGIDDEFASPSATFDVLAAGAMAGFASALARHWRPFDVQPAMSAGRKNSCDVRVAIRAGLVPHERGAGHRRWQGKSATTTRAGIQHECHSAREGQHAHEPEIIQNVGQASHARQFNGETVYFKVACVACF